MSDDEHKKVQVVVKSIKITFKAESKVRETDFMTIYAPVPKIRSEVSVETHTNRTYHTPHKKSHQIK